MLLSQTAEYALRAMAWLALESPEVPVRAKDLAVQCIQTGKDPPNGRRALGEKRSVR